MTTKSMEKQGTVCPDCGCLSDINGNQITVIDSDITLWSKKGYESTLCQDCLEVKKTAKGVRNVFIG